MNAILKAAIAKHERDVWVSAMAPKNDTAVESHKHVKLITVIKRSCKAYQHYKLDTAYSAIKKNYFDLNSNRLIQYLRNFFAQIFNIGLMLSLSVLHKTY